MSARDLITGAVRETVSRHKLEAMMDAAIAECIAEGRADPKAKLVCVLNKPWHPGRRIVAQKWRDEAAEHLAVRRDAA